MYKNIVIVGLVLVVAVETGYIVMKRNSASQPVMVQSNTSPSPSSKPKPMMVSKGQKLADSPLGQYAYQIVPGPISADATKAIVGFNVKSQVLADGSTQVDLIPKDSEDQYQRYVLKKGELLYFVEMTPADDKADSDKDLNYRDDYGIITDANGIIQ